MPTYNGHLSRKISFLFFWDSAFPECRRRAASACSWRLAMPSCWRWRAERRGHTGSWPALRAHYQGSCHYWVWPPCPEAGVRLISGPRSRVMEAGPEAGVSTHGHSETTVEGASCQLSRGIQLCLSCKIFYLQYRETNNCSVNTLYLYNMVTQK